MFRSSNIVISLDWIVMRIVLERMKTTRIAGSPISNETPIGSSTMPCEHAIDIEPVPPRTRGCEECLRLGMSWVHLRLCLICGHVGCCDDSPNRHAMKHFKKTGHPIIQSFEPGEDW